MHTKWKFFWVGVAILAALEWRSWRYYLLPPPDFSHGQIILYATDWCPYCEKTRAMLQQRQIDYTEMNIETSPEAQAQYRQLAGKGVPVLLIAGEVVRGYNEKYISAALDRWQASQASPQTSAKQTKESKANR